MALFSGSGIQLQLDFHPVCRRRIFTDAAHTLCHQLFADDMRGYCSGSLDDVHGIVSQVEYCTAEISAWFVKWLQRNASTTEVLSFGLLSLLRQLSSDDLTSKANQTPIKVQTISSGSRSVGSVV